MNNFFSNLGGMAQNVLGGMKQMGQMANEAEMVMQILRLYKNGGDPMQILSQMAQSSPQMAQAAQMLEGKSPQQIQSMVQNMANQNGIDLTALAAQFGLALPK